MSEARLAPRRIDLPDASALAEAASSKIAEALADGLARSGKAALAATGGSSPIACYQRLAMAPLDWSRIDVTLSDERWVPPASADSNERMVRQNLLNGPARAARFIPLWSDAATPEAAASRVEPSIVAMSPFDMVLLGMGDDGHFASLFPGNPALAQGLDPDCARWCIGVPAGSPAPPQPRISLTLSALLKAGRILVLITGEAKRQVVDAALAGADLPIRRLLGQDRTPVDILWSP